MKAATLFSKYVEREDYRLFVVVNFISYLGFFTHLIFIPLFFWINVDILAWFNFFSVTIWFVSFLLNRRGLHTRAIVLISLEVFLHAVVATYILGWDSGFHYYLVPFVLFIFINHKQSLLLIGMQTVSIFIVYLWMLLTTRGEHFQNVISSDVMDGFQFLNIAINFLAIGLLGYALRTSSMRAEWEMEQLAITDALTGLYNRRKIYAVVEMEQARLQRSGKSSVLVISDIDLFKEVNDQYGHDSGDYVLREVSALMLSTLRKQDVISRWGGEEFIMLLPETDMAGAKRVIEVLREVIASHDFKHNSKQMTVTMTFGMALLDGRQPIEAVLKQADKFLYQGKEKGRNCVVTLQDFNLESNEFLL